MEKKKTYARKLTKEMLVANGIELITEDGKVFKNGKQVNLSQDKQGYLKLHLYEVDEDGNIIKIPITKIRKGCKKPSTTYCYKIRTVGLHRAMWAWIHGVVEEGFVIDHRSNQHTSIEDYHISNLQILTPRENTIKDCKVGTRELKCRLDKPISYYEDKLAHYEDLYQKAVKKGDKREIDNLVHYINYRKAQIRYWLLHKKEAEVEYDNIN